LIFDSNVVIDLLDSDRGSPAFERIDSLRRGRPAFINEIIFAEISMRFLDCGLAQRACDVLELSIETLKLPECHRAGRAFADYRRRGGERRAILPDFLIGAQAAERGWPLVTRDRGGFARYFPELTIMDPPDER